MWPFRQNEPFTWGEIIWPHTSNKQFYHTCANCWKYSAMLVICFWQLCFCQSCRTGKKIVSRNKNKSFSCFVLSWIWMSVEIEASPAQFFKIVVQSELTFPFAGVKLENFWFSQKSRHMRATALDIRQAYFFTTFPANPANGFAGTLSYFDFVELF